MLSKKLVCYYGIKYRYLMDPGSTLKVLNHKTFFKFLKTNKDTQLKASSAVKFWTFDTFCSDIQQAPCRCPLHIWAGWAPQH